MKKRKIKMRYKVISLLIAIILLLPIPNKNKKELFTKIENLYYKYIKKIDNVVIPVSTDIKLEGNIIDEEELELENFINIQEIEKPLSQENLNENIELEDQRKMVVNPNELELEQVINNKDKEEPEIVDAQEELKQVALTFDDGPSIYTEELLEILKENNATATFFVIGSRIDKYGSVIEKIKNDGHQIGSHGINHEDFTKLKTEELKRILEETKFLLDQYGVSQTLVRPPYGSINNRVKENIEYPLIMWSLDTRDWEHRDSEKGTQIIIENIEDGSIILMHDLYKSTIDTVKSVLPILKEQGYEFVTVEELLEETELEKGKIYYKKIK